MAPRPPTDSGAAGGWGLGASPPSRPRPAPARFLLPGRAGGAVGPAFCPAPRGQPRAAAPCPPTGSGAASCRGVRSPRRDRPGPAPAPCPTGGPASCAAQAPAPAPPTPRAARTPGQCAARCGAARCPGTQATPSECPAPSGPPAPDTPRSLRLSILRPRPPPCDPAWGPVLTEKTGQAE